VQQMSTRDADSLFVCAQTNLEQRVFKMSAFRKSASLSDAQSFDVSIVHC